jgi:hypothetical protein
MKRKRQSKILIDISSDSDDDVIVSNMTSLITKKVKTKSIVFDFKTLPKKILKMICFMYLRDGTDRLNFIVAFSMKNDSFIYENGIKKLYPTIQNIKRWLTTSDRTLFENKDLEGIKYLHLYYKVDFGDCAYEYAIWYGNIEMIKWFHHVGYEIKLIHLSIAIAIGNLSAIRYFTSVLKYELRCKIDTVVESSIKIIKQFENNNTTTNFNGKCMKTKFQKNVDSYIQFIKEKSDCKTNMT